MVSVPLSGTVIASISVMEGLTTFTCLLSITLASPVKFSPLLPSRISNNAFKVPDMELAPALKLLPVFSHLTSYKPSISDWFTLFSLATHFNVS